MGKLMSKCVYIKIKDEYHLNELFDLCEKYNKPIYKNDFNFKTRVFSYNKINRKHSGYYYECDRTEVTIEEFEQILKSEQQWEN